MLIPSAIITNTWWAQAQKPIFPALFRIFSTSRPITSVSPKASYSVDVNCINFLPWLEEKAGTKICTALSIGKSSHGRALYASENIIAGDCLFKIPYSVQLAPDNLPQDITCLLGGEVGHVAKLALFILREQRLGQNSGWEPYISLLPQPEDLHSTVFWSNDELKMIQPSALYKETLRQKTQIEKDFFSVKLAFDRFPDGFQVVTLQEFTYAYGLVTSRAWGSSRGVSMIPFADFLNHDCSSEAYVLSDEGKQHSEVIADRNYASGDQVMIRYGKFSNATLLLDFGFSVSYNQYDQVRIGLTPFQKAEMVKCLLPKYIKWIRSLEKYLLLHYLTGKETIKVQVDLNICQNDVLYAQKLELLDRYQTPSVKDINDFTSSRNSFIIKEVRADSRKGKGIPQSLRAFCRIMSSKSLQELNALVIEAAQNDGRLARRPLKNKNREIEAHQLLLSEISQFIEKYKAYIKLLGPTPPYLCEKGALRSRLAQDLLVGELRVLKSASAWLKSYCSTIGTN